MDENIKRIATLTQAKVSGYVGGQEGNWIWDAFHRKYEIKNRFNIIVGVVFLGMTTYFLWMGTMPFIVAGAIVGIVGIKRLLDYNFSIETSIMDEIINRFEK